MHVATSGSTSESDSSSRLREGLRVAFLLRRFPTLSETFILSQVTGLMDAGVDLEVFAWAPSDEPAVHPEIAQYDLLRRTRYLKPPPSRLRRIGKTASLIVGGRGWRHPSALLRSLDVRHDGQSESLFRLLYAAASFLHSDPYDIVHCQFGHLGLDALALREIGALPGRLVVSFRGADLTAHGREKRYEDLLRTADLLLPVCGMFRDRLVAMGCESSKVRVHRSGIDLRRFPFTERRRDEKGPIRLLTIARFVEKKGVKYAIEATSRIKSTGRGVVHHIVGDGPLRPELERLARELGVQDVVRFMGPRDHHGVAEALAWAHILVAPSVTARSGDKEGIPNVLKEAMATGMPVVSTMHSGIPELIEDGVSGFLVPERDVEVLARQLTHLTDHPERWAEMGRAGRKRIEAEYDSERLNGQLLRLYREVLSTPRSG